MVLLLTCGVTMQDNYDSDADPEEVTRQREIIRQEFAARGYRLPD